MNKLAIALLFIPALLQAQFNCQQSKMLMSQMQTPSINNNAKSDTFDIHHYQLELDLTGIQQQNFKASTNLHFSPKIAGVNRLNLDLLELTVDSIRYRAPGGTFSGNGFSYTYNDSLLALNLNQAISINDTGVFKIYYSGNPKKDASGWGGFHSGQGYFYNLGVGFAANPHTFGRAWFPCFDNFVEKSTYTLKVYSRQPLQPLLSGHDIQRSIIRGDTVLSTASLSQPTPTYLVSFALANYEFLSDTVMGLNGPVDILLAAKASDTVNLKSSFRNLKQVFHAFENWFGPYEWPRIGYAITTQGAMEHATSIHYPISLVDGTLSGEDIMAHELAHHWFGNLVTCQTAEDMWINEGMAEYLSHLYRESLYGKKDYTKTVRDNAFNVLNYAHSRDNGYAPIYGPENEYTYGYHTYQKGAMVGHNLRHYLGDSLYFNGMETVLQQNKFGNITTAQFQSDLIAATGKNELQDFFSDWIFSAGFPQFQVDDWTYNPLLQRIDLSITQHLYEAPALHNSVPVDVTFLNEQGDSLSMTFKHSGKTSRHSGILLPFEPTVVLSNYGGNLLTASTYDHIKINGNHPLPTKYSELNLSVESFSDSGRIIAMHHLAPADKKAANPFDFKLSNSRYWSVYKLGLDSTELKASIRFDGSIRGWDQYLLQYGNDSLVVLYRAKGSDLWNIYPHQQKNTGSSNSKVGTLELQPLLAGDYVLANTAESIGFHGNTMIKNGFQVYPNPANRQLIVETAELIAGKVAVEIIDSSGKAVFSQSYSSAEGAAFKKVIGIAHLPQGQYQLLINKSSFAFSKR